MLERETLIFWIAAQRLRLTAVVVGGADIQEALDDLMAVRTHTESATLAQRCAELLDREAPLCGFSA